MADQKDFPIAECRLVEKQSQLEQEEHANGNKQAERIGSEANKKKEATGGDDEKSLAKDEKEHIVAQHRKTRCVMRIQARPLFWLRYNSMENAYESSDKDYEKKCWSTLIYTSQNMEYMYERGWATSYIARHEGCFSDQAGSVRWRFDLSDLGDRWKRVEVHVNAKLWRGTKAELHAMSYESIGQPLLNQVELEVSALNTLTREQLNRAARVIDLEATLSGGDLGDSSSWQRPQLFRQTEWRDKDEWPFRFTVY